MRLESDNMAYTAVDGVFQVFRRRLTAQQGLDFASVLPSVLRAIFVSDWKPSDLPEPFADRETLIAEVKQVRVNHNLTPHNAVEATAWALWRCVDHRDFERVLERLPGGAKEFWYAEVDDPKELEQRIV